MPVVLIIAGSDSSGGAGIAADLRTLAAFDCSPRIALTAATAQGPGGVTDMHVIPPASTRRQIEAALDGGVDAIKIGMLATRAHVEMLADVLAQCGDRPPVVLDPVLAASAGGRLLQLDAEAVLRELLLPLVTVATPNRAEAAVLARGSDVGEWASDQPVSILVTGGDTAADTVVDTLYASQAPAIEFSAPRTPGPSPRGTGCALSTAIAARLGAGDGLEAAVGAAIGYVQRRIALGEL